MLHPEQATHRSAAIGVDLALMLALHINTLKPFVGKEELVHIEMNALYCLIDLLGSTCNTDPDLVLDQCKVYFRRLRQETETL